MWRASGLVTVLVVMVAGCEWVDLTGPRIPSGTIEVTAGVRLEFVDYGGTGDPVILLAGSGNSARVFDGFAPRLTGRFRVVALTRRGFGQSSQPAGGYDTRTRAEDIRSALDRFGFRRAHLVGHSLAGDEMTRLAIDHPDRVGRLVYLDAGYDRVDLAELVPYMPVPPAPAEEDTRSAAGYGDYLERVYGVRWPATEVRNVNRFGPDGRLVGPTTPLSVVQATIAGVEHPDYRSVRAASLAIYAVARTAADIAAWLIPDSPGWADATEYLTLGWQPYSAGQRARFRTEMTRGEVIEVPGANHYVFLSHPDLVANAVRSFLGRGWED